MLGCCTLENMVIIRCPLTKNNIEIPLEIKVKYNNTTTVHLIIMFGNALLANQVNDYVP